MQHRVSTNKDCPKCGELLDKIVDIQRMVMVYICTGCNAQFKSNPGSNDTVGDEIVSDNGGRDDRDSED